MRQERAQLQYPVPQAGLRGAQGNSQLPRHLAVGKTLEVRKLQRLSLYRGKPCDRGADLRATNPNPSGLDHLVAGGFRGGVDMGFIPAPQRCFVADGIDGFVVNCGEEVGGDTPAGGVEPGGTLPDRQEGLLDQSSAMVRLLQILRARPSAWEP